MLAALNETERRLHGEACVLGDGLEADDQGVVPNGVALGRNGCVIAPADEFAVTGDDAAKLLPVQSLGVGEGAL